jgi:hypothetical protein
MSAIFLLLSAAGAPPDTSLFTIPVVYYGANWNRSDANVDVLARMQMVILMQEDGSCWAKCCPNRFKSGSQCGWTTSDAPATSLPGCDATCSQHDAQSHTFERIQSSAHRQGLRAPHSVLYVNSVYLWPFDAASARGDDLRVLDVHGAPHMETCARRLPIDQAGPAAGRACVTPSPCVRAACPCVSAGDPGIYPSYFWDFSRSAGRGTATATRTLLSSLPCYFLVCFALPSGPAPAPAPSGA